MHPWEVISGSTPHSPDIFTKEVAMKKIINLLKKIAKWWRGLDDRYNIKFDPPDDGGNLFW